MFRELLTLPKATPTHSYALINDCNSAPYILWQHPASLAADGTAASDTTEALAKLLPRDIQVKKTHEIILYYSLYCVVWAWFILKVE
jgi:hypothetical protein